MSCDIHNEIIVFQTTTDIWYASVALSLVVSAHEGLFRLGFKLRQTLYIRTQEALFSNQSASSIIYSMLYPLAHLGECIAHIAGSKPVKHIM